MDPLVSCIMVTANRPRFCERAIRCYRAQTYSRRELVVIDDGEQDLEPVLRNLPSSEVRYVRLDRAPGRFLGALRNVGLETARGEIVVQWDDDDWYHPTRIETQVQALREGADACTLFSTLVHVNTDALRDHPFRGSLRHGVPGTIMHRRDDGIRYPNLPIGEDTVYLKAWRRRRYASLPDSESYLFIRCFHRSNLWAQKHFVRRIRNTGAGLFAYVWCRYILRDLFRHPSFCLDARQREAFEMYLLDSRALRLH
jgi:glycosyltransferase involved in cell wall biosynthesis